EFHESGHSRGFDWNRPLARDAAAPNGGRRAEATERAAASPVSGRPPARDSEGPTMTRIPTAKRGLFVFGPGRTRTGAGDPVLRLLLAALGVVFVAIL